MTMLKKILLLSWYVISSLIIFCAVLGVSLQLLTPVINKHKGYIEQQIAHFLHMEIQVKHIEASWVRFGPEFRFTGVTLLENNHAALEINQLTLNLNLIKTFWKRTVFFRYISLSGSEIILRETESQHYLLNDTFLIDLTHQDVTSNKDIIGWLIAQNRLHVANVRTKIELLNHVDASLEVKQADFYQTSKGLSAAIEANILTETIEARKISRCLSGSVMLSLWANFANNARHFVEVELLMKNLSLKEGKKNDVSPNFRGVFLWQPIGKDWWLQAKEMTLQSSKSSVPRHFSFELMRFSDHYAAHVAELNLADMVSVLELAHLMPKGFDSSAVNFQGKAQDINVVAPKDLSALSQYQFSAILNKVSSAAYHHFPAMQHVSAVVSGGIAQGDFSVFTENDAIYFPEYFNQTIPIKTLTTHGQWQYSADQFSLWLPSIQVALPTVDATGALRLDIPLKQPENTFLSLLAEYHLAQSNDAIKYLPMKKFSHDFSQWLTSAVIGGKGSDGKVLVRGKVTDFPYLQHDGTFIVDGSIKPMQFSISPEWPTLNSVSGKLRFHNQGFFADINTKFAGVRLTQAKISVPDYYQQPVVLVDLHAQGDVPSYLKFVNSSPLKVTLGVWLSPFVIHGQGKLTLHLELPIEHLNDNNIKVTGQWLAQQVDFTWAAIQLGLKKISGTLHFTEDSLTANHVQAQLEREPVRLDVSTEKMKNNAGMAALHVDAMGVMSVKQIETLANIHWLSTYISGKSDYHAHLRVPFNTAEYKATLESNLQGMKINLPENLGKKEKTSAPFELKFLINPTADTAQLNLKYQKNISVIADIQHYSKSNSNPCAIQIKAKAVAFSWPLPLVLPKVSAKDSSSLWQSLTSFTLQLSHLSLYKNNFSSVVVSATRQINGFLWRIAANEAQGQVTVPDDLRHEPIKANFDYLTLVTPKNKASAAMAISAKEAAIWPEFFLNVQHFKIDAENLGGVILHTSPITKGIAFKDIQINNPLYQLSSHGQWINAGTQDKTYLEGLFKAANVGQFLKETKITNNFQAQAGVVNYNVVWPGSPFNFQLEKIEGDTKVNVKNGVIPVSGDAAKMGLGKVLSLFSVQSIQRRLKLNFSDLRQNGYSFNSLISQLHLQAGNAMLKTGAFDGPEAKIAFSGRIGLARKDYDVKLIVTPYITSTLPLIATLAGGPIAGAAVYAFDKIAESSIAKITSYHYLLLGPWSQPHLIDLDAQSKQRAQAEQARLEAKNVPPVEEARN